MAAGSAADGGSTAGGESEGTPGEPREQLAAIYGALATGCGYPYPVIDAMTLAEAGEIFAYWEHDPPAHLIVQIDRAAARMGALDPVLFPHAADR